MIPLFIALFVFALVHTYLAGRFKPVFRQRFGERAYEGLYRVLYNIFALISLLPALALVAQQPAQIVWQIEDWFTWVLAAIQVIGVIGLMLSLLQIDFLRFAGLRQLWTYLNDQPLPLPDEKLQTKGVFRLVRHPLYLFSMLATWPVATMTDVYLAFCIGVTAYFMIGSVLEERRLEAAYGDVYREYRQRVSWLFPRF